MRAWRVHELGEPGDVMVLDDVEPPEPGPGEVAVDVAAAACNFADVLLCRGTYQEHPTLPFVPGSEVAGTVAAVGPGVTRVEPGQRVVAIPRVGAGAFTERTVAAEDAVHPLPDAIGWMSAAAMPVTYQTAHVGLHRRAGLRAGETLLVHAGAGGAGSAAIQLGLAAGAHVLATAGGPEKVAVCRELGAHVAIDHRADDFVDLAREHTEGRGADVVYDPVGGDVFDRSRRCVAFEGRIVVVGFASGRFAEAPTNHVMIKNYSVVGVHWALYRRHDPAHLDAVHADLVDLASRGLVAPLISEVVALGDVAAALARLARGGTIGKVVCEVAGR